MRKEERERGKEGSERGRGREDREREGMEEGMEGGMEGGTEGGMEGESHLQPGFISEKVKRGNERTTYKRNLGAGGGI